MIGETGTGCGVGLAWPQGRHRMHGWSVSNVTLLAHVQRATFTDDPRVTIPEDDWSAVVEHRPFDLLDLDGGGQGKKGGQPVDPQEWLTPGGIVVLDDFTPSDSWPPTYEGQTDEIRLH